MQKRRLADTARAVHEQDPGHAVRIEQIVEGRQLALPAHETPLTRCVQPITQACGHDTSHGRDVKCPSLKAIFLGNRQEVV
ncbi:hypothetical protein Aph01nite_04270 [Acrocarpospora phusangensis]|uniref:Uncharacterized protein n=1 Tax=Acrocarpospora phusangensis TaxID=1070424 RepID=A0A919Q4F0_9ACTN|nr:hypothetical protein Aph01nite_04270 [Acrocarpospora phusangensis]